MDFRQKAKGVEDSRLEQFAFPSKKMPKIGNFTMKRETKKEHFEKKKANAF